MKKRIHYCWMILFSCCMLQGAGFGIVNNCSGLFYEPIAREIGFSIGAVSLYFSISVIVSCAVMLFATQLLERFRARFILTLASVCTCVPMFMMSFCHELWQWYVLAIVQGMGLAFTTNLIVPIILNNWFHKRLGLALGLSVSSGGIVGTIMSTLLGAIIRSGSWRSAYRIAGSIGLVMTIPVCLFVLYIHPEDKGMLPYGETRNVTSVQIKAKHGRGFGKRLMDVRLWKLIPIIAFGRISTAFMSHITTYGNSIGFAIMDASILTTLFMIGNMLSKICFGAMNDRYGAQKCSFWSLGIILIAEILLITANDLFMLAGALLFGTASMFSQVQITILCRNSWDSADYADALVVVQVISQIFFSIGITGLGYGYDFLGDYRPLIMMLIASVFVAASFVYWIFRKNHSHN